MPTVPFQIYNASAGSGKTYTLVKECLTILLADDSVQHIKNILALTFTNKAVAEMKERLLAHLKALAQEISSEMGSALCEACAITSETLQKRATNVLKFILHNYAFLDVLTIDGFNHKLIRTFAHDLRLSGDFQVTTDTKLYIEEAVENLIEKAGKHEILAQMLIDFAISKADEDTSWDITLDVTKIANLLLEENHYQHVEGLKDKTIDDFSQLHQMLIKTIDSKKKVIKTKAGNVLKRIETHGLGPSDFTQGTLFNHFKKIESGDWAGLYNNQLEENLSKGTIYTSTLSPEKAGLIDFLLPELRTEYHELKEAIFHCKFLQNFYKNLVPLSLLSAVRNEVEQLKQDRNTLLISEFNSLISQTIANQPAPFIYERIGEKYRHYFIDEFQDTSRMQWENILPLVSHALQSETSAEKHGTLLLVGDPKQAIYRWRGSDPEQFIRLYQCHNPFDIEKKVTSLPRNYRSFDEIISFNNTFFHHIASFLTHPDYRDFYENKSYQEPTEKKGGEVILSFIDKESDEDTYCQQVLYYINQSLQQGFAYGDICVLTRKRKEGVVIASYLTQNHINVVSSETLLLQHSPVIQFLINLIKHLLNPEDKEIRLTILYFLAERNPTTEKHDFLFQYLNSFNQLLEKYSFQSDVFLKLSLYEALQYASQTFALAESSDAYLHYFLDEALAFMKQEGSHLQRFIDHWEKKKDQLSIIAPQTDDAVQLITIHKAKGLEFPVVIYPFANTHLYGEIDAKWWLPVDNDIYGISYSLFNKNKDLAQWKEEYAKLYNQWEEQLQLDHFNILYVALTRAIEKLCIIAPKDLDNKGKEKTDYFSGLFINYLKTTLLWSDSENTYTFGSISKKQTTRKKIQTETIPFFSQPFFQNYSKIIPHQPFPIELIQQKAIEEGDRYHSILAKIEYVPNLESAIQEAVEEGILSPGKEKEYHIILKKIIHHPTLKNYFTLPYTIYNEREIYLPSGEIVRPDRVAFHNQNAVVIEYKTGAYRAEYTTQLHYYARCLEEMGIMIENKLLVFINDDVQVMPV